MNAKIQTSFLNFKIYTKECLLQENIDIHVQSQSSFLANSPKGNILYNQSNFANKRNSFFLQINSDITTLATFDHDLNLSLHFFLCYHFGIFKKLNYYIDTYRYTIVCLG